uniref:Uncharacterized protein n=1 Tax=Haptolina ericina TaxID=156174 RepID=A0A7S3ET79_9EUKA
MTFSTDPMGKFGYRCAEASLKALDETKLVDYLNEIECYTNPELDQIPAKIEVCKELDTLLAYGCSIQAVPTQITAAKRTLKVLNLSSNKIPELPVQLGELGALTEVDFSSNLLTTVPDAVLAGWVKVEFLYLNDNKLTSLGSLTSCTALYELRLQGNLLDAVPMIGELGELERVDLSRNKLTGGEEAIKLHFDKCPALKTLTLVAAEPAVEPEPVAVAKAAAEAEVAAKAKADGEAALANAAAEAEAKAKADAEAKAAAVVASRAQKAEEVMAAERAKRKEAEAKEAAIKAKEDAERAEAEAAAKGNQTAEQRAAAEAAAAAAAEREAAEQRSKMMQQSTRVGGQHKLKM